MTDKARKLLLQQINEDAVLQSLLYDLALMPEQLTAKSPRWETVTIIAGHIAALRAIPPVVATARERAVVKAAMICWKYEPVNSAEVGYTRRFTRLMQACARLAAKRREGEKG